MNYLSLDNGIHRIRMKANEHKIFRLEIIN